MTSSNAANAGMASSAKPAPRAGELTARIVSGGALGVMLLAAIWAGGDFYALVIVGCAATALAEWLRIVNSTLASLSTVLAITLLVFLGGVSNQVPAALALALLFMLFFGLLMCLLALGSARPYTASLGFLYIGGSVVALFFLRQIPDHGEMLVYFLMISVWANDTGAYASGRFFGGVKLWPKVSPSKTWAGLFGGIIIAMIFGTAVALLFSFPMPILAALLAVLLALSAVGGDLLESKLKRIYHVRHSSGLIPGHGGMLDRIDGLIPASLVFAVLSGTFGAEVFA